MPFQDKGALFVGVEEVPRKLTSVAAAVELVMPEGMFIIQRVTMRQHPSFADSPCYAVQTSWMSEYFSDELCMTAWAYTSDNFVSVDFQVGMYGKLQEFRDYIALGSSAPDVRSHFVESVADGLLSEVGMFKTLNFSGKML